MGVAFGVGVGVGVGFGVGLGVAAFVGAGVGAAAFVGVAALVDVAALVGDAAFDGATAPDDAVGAATAAGLEAAVDGSTDGDGLSPGAASSAGGAPRAAVSDGPVAIAGAWSAPEYVRTATRPARVPLDTRIARFMRSSSGLLPALARRAGQKAKASWWMRSRGTPASATAATTRSVNESGPQTNTSVPVSSGTRRVRYSAVIGW